MAEDTRKLQVDQFIIEQIDSVPHLEALLLIWRTRPKEWSVTEMAKALYVPSEVAERVLNDLAQRELVARVSEHPNTFRYDSTSAERDALLYNVNDTYRRELVRISGMIHSKAGVAVRDFARAFRFKKD